jgi:hypothetical protein
MKFQNFTANNCSASSLSTTLIRADLFTGGNVSISGIISAPSVNVTIATIGTFKSNLASIGTLYTTIFNPSNINTTNLTAATITSTTVSAGSLYTNVFYPTNINATNITSKNLFITGGNATIYSTSYKPTLNPDAFNSMIVYEDMSQTTLFSSFVTSGSSWSYNQNTGGNTGYIQLGTTTSGNSCMYWNIHPGNSFSTTFDFFAGGGTGADEIHFFWYMPSVPSQGAYNNGLSNCYNVWYSEFQNNICLNWNGVTLATYSITGLGNSTWRTTTITCVQNVIRVLLNGVVVINYYDTTNRNINSSNSYMGFSASTGALNNNHRIRNIKISKLSDSLLQFTDISSGNLVLNGSSLGVGKIPTTTLDVSGGASITGTVSAGTFVGALMSSGSIGTGGATMGTLYVNGNINFNSSLYQNGSVISSNGNLILTNSVYTPNISNTVTRTFLEKTAESISVKDFGAIGDGINNDTSAFQNAANNSLSVYIPPGTYKITSSITCASRGVTFKGAGRGATFINATGSFDLFAFSGSAINGGIYSLNINGVGVTSGNLVSIIGQGRFNVKDVIMTSGYNGIYIQDQNCVSLCNIWINNLSGQYYIKNYGSSSASAHILDIDNVIVGGAGSTSTSPIGLLIDSGVNTVDIRHFSVGTSTYGIKVTNSLNLVNQPAFITSYDFQCDYPYVNGIYISDNSNLTETHMFTDSYIHGSITGDGIYLGSSSTNVSFIGGKISGNYKRGFYINGRYSKITGCHITGNSHNGTGLFPHIQLSSNVIGVIISNNLLGQWIGFSSEYASYGILIDSGAQTYSITNNNFNGNVTGDYLDNSNNSNSVILGNLQASTTGNIINSSLYVSNIVSTASLQSTLASIGTLNATTITAASVQLSGSATIQGNGASLNINNITDTSETSIKFYSNSTSGAWYVGQNVGGVGTGNFAIYRDGTGNYITATTSGNIGIRTNTPSSTLDVNGTINASSYTGSSLSVTNASIGTINANIISTGTLYVSGSVVSVNVTTLNLINNNITTSSLVSTFVTSANGLFTNVTTSSLYISGTVSAATYVGTLMSSGSMGARGITTGSLYAGIITSGNVQVSGTVSAATYVGTLMSSGSIGAGNITVGTLTATNVYGIDFGLNFGDQQIGLANFNTSGFYGFGANNDALQYQVAPSASHVFYTDSTTLTLGTVIATISSSGISSSNAQFVGATIGTLYANNSTNASLVLNNSSIIFRTNDDMNHGLTYNETFDGPELWGWGGGALGYGGFNEGNSLVWTSSGISVTGTVSSESIGVTGATVGTLYSTTITSGAIQTTNLTVSSLIRSPNAIFTNISVGNITTSSIGAGGITTGNLYVSTFSGANVQLSGTVSAAKYVGTLVSSGSIGARGITTGNLYVSTFSGSNVQLSGTVSAATYVGTLMSSGSIGARGITTGNLYVSTFSGANVQLSGTVSAATHVGTLVSSGSIGARGITTGNLYLNYGFTGQDPDAGTIAYQKFSSNLDIVGAGPSGGVPRIVQIWDYLQTSFVNADSLSVTNITSSNIISTVASVGNLYTTTFYPTNISATNITASNIISTVASVGNLYTNVFNPTNISAINISTSTLQATNSTTTNGVFTNISTGTLSLTNLNVTNITANNIIVTNGSLRATFNSNTLGNLYTTGGNILLGTNIEKITYTRNITSSSYSLPPAASGTINGVNITALQRRIRPSNGAQNRAVTNWLQRTIPNARSWVSVCWSSELGIFCAVCKSAAFVMTSPDGITWTERSIPNTRNWCTIRWASELGLFCVINYGSAAVVMTSPDGTNWTERSIPNNRGWLDLCWSPELSLFCAVNNDGFAAVIMTSPNGITWTERSIPSAATWQCVCWSPELGLFCAVNSNTAVVMISNDGISWSQKSIPNAYSWQHMAWSPELGIFCAVNNGSAVVMISPDGITWTEYSIPHGYYWGGLCWSPELSLFCAVNNNSSNVVMTSPDGIVWTERSIPANYGYITVCWSSDLGIFCAVNSFSSNVVLTSTMSLSNSLNTVLAPKSQFTITTNGNIGVNITSPSTTARLHIYDPLVTGTNFSTCSLLIDRFNTTPTTTGSSYSGCHIMLRGGYDSANGTTDTNTTMDAGTAGNNRNDFIACLGGTTGSFSWDSSNYTGIVFVVQGAGNAYNAKNVWGAISDVRVKENIIDSRNYLDDLNKLRVVKYSLKADKVSEPNQLGLIAQEVEQVFPGLITSDLNNYGIDENGNTFRTKGIKHSIINMMMLKSIQELSAKNDNLQLQLNTLLNKIDTL